MIETVNGVYRKSLLYKTGVEYGDYTVNHVQGCSHGCKYPCYAYLMAKRFGRAKNYAEWVKPIIVSNAIELLNKELPRLKDKIQSVQLCFTTDPFMFGYENISKVSIEIIKLINSYGIRCTALTKGLLPIELAELSSENAYGITLISLNEKFREDMEPGASPYMDRIQSLRALHDKGCKTWVSIEPYPTPNIFNQNFDQLLESVSFTDRIIFGRLHYNAKVTAYSGYKEYYNNLSDQVIRFCEENNIAWHIKTGTKTN